MNIHVIHAYVGANVVPAVVTEICCLISPSYLKKNAMKDKFSHPNKIINGGLVVLSFLRQIFLNSPSKSAALSVAFPGRISISQFYLEVPLNP